MNEVQTSQRPGERRLAEEATGRNADRVRAVLPPVDILEDQTGITLYADLPGVPRENLTVRVEGEDLVIEASVRMPKSEQMELVYGEAQVPAYRRQFSLSRELDSSRIDASMKDGVLRLCIPKAEDAKPRRIEVKTG